MQRNDDAFCEAQRLQTAITVNTAVGTVPAKTLANVTGQKERLPMSRKRILIVEDMRSVALAYAVQIEKAGHACVCVETAAAALAAIEAEPDFAAVLLDLQLPDADGLDLLRANPAILQNYPVIVATADASLSRAIEAMRIGAFDFLVKPIAASRLLAVLGSALELGGRDAAGAPAPAATPVATRTGLFIGSSPRMEDVYRQIECVANSRATVFITGESGTGKEVCAQAIHQSSSRATGPFVAINCGAIPENLLESEIFGHLKGSFTGAVSDRIGAAQAAHKGTLFLDEICEMPLALQVKLLRFLQTGTVQRVGSNRIEDVDVRIVCATNRDPAREVAQGRFREDLYYRLAVVPLAMPPLRDRPGDVAVLANEFLQRFAREEGKTFAALTPMVLAALDRHEWPGNVRELQNVMRRAAVLNPGPDLPLSALALGPTTARDAAPATPASPGAEAVDTPALARMLAGLSLDEIERIAIEAAISAAGGSLPAAARALGLSPSTLYRKRERWQDRAASS
jgi:two-component system, repressor protein LuxO